MEVEARGDCHGEKAMEMQAMEVEARGDCPGEEAMGICMGMAWKYGALMGKSSEGCHGDMHGDAMEVGALWGRHGEEAVGIYAWGCHGSRGRMGNVIGRRPSGYMQEGGGRRRRGEGEE